MATVAETRDVFFKGEVKRLSVYAEKLRQQIGSEKDANKRSFFERDLKKTLAKIEKYR
jgi:hypothetical protein